jgi:thiosulfate dehydrogenase [quinone] large subunit
MSASTRLSIGLFLARVPLGIYFLMAGAAKIKGGVGNFVANASKTTPAFLPEALGKAYLYALPFAECLVGVLVTIGLFTRIAAGTKALMLISFLIAVGLKDDPKPFHSNIMLLGFALLLTLEGGGSISVDHLLRRKGKSGSA